METAYRKIHPTNALREKVLRVLKKKKKAMGCC